MPKTFSFLGAGNMGSAILTAFCSHIDPAYVMVTDKNPENAAQLAAKNGCRTAQSNAEAAAFADYVIFCVKPHIMPEVLEETAEILKSRQNSNRPAVLVSIAAGVTVAEIRRYAGAEIPIIRLMPNMPAQIGRGITVLCGGGNETPEHLSDIENMLKACGSVIRLPENMFDQATVASSCSPAYAYMFIEALADAGVYAGLSRADALTLSANALIGAASMVLETGMSPGALKDMVCSPSGSTIRGVASLEESAFRGSVIRAFLKSYERNVELGQSKP